MWGCKLATRHVTRVEPPPPPFLKEIQDKKYSGREKQQQEAVKDLQAGGQEVHCPSLAALALPPNPYLQPLPCL
jgi:hypothetical protein